MTIAHTPGRLNVDGLRLTPTGSRIAMAVVRENPRAVSQEIARGEAEANAQRLALCWNACQGVPIEVLRAQSAGGRPWGVADQLDQREKMDELARVLERLAGFARHYASDSAMAAGGTRMVEDAYAILAKVGRPRA